MRTLFNTRLLALLSLLAVCSGVSYGQRRGRPANTPVQITGMKVIPYDRMSDSFSEDISNSGGDHLNELDNSYLIKVEISGKSGEFNNRSVTVTVHEGTKLLLTRNTLVGIFNEQGKYFIPVWIYGPLCSTTTIEAKLMGQGKPSVIRKKIGFACGE